MADKWRSTHTFLQISRHKSNWYVQSVVATTPPYYLVVMPFYSCFFEVNMVIYLCSLVILRAVYVCTHMKRKMTFRYVKASGSCFSYQQNKCTQWALPQHHQLFGCVQPTIWFPLVTKITHAQMRVTRESSVEQRFVRYRISNYWGFF